MAAHVESRVGYPGVAGQAGRIRNEQAQEAAKCRVAQHTLSNELCEARELERRTAKDQDRIDDVALRRHIIQEHCIVRCERLGLMPVILATATTALARKERKAHTSLHQANGKHCRQDDAIESSR
jgi:hypothetical protein